MECEVTLRANADVDVAFDQKTTPGVTHREKEREGVESEFCFKLRS